MDDSTLPRPQDPDSALPSVGARVAAFVAIFVGGAAGAVIGWSFTKIQCGDGNSCDVSQGVWLWVGSLIGALGVAVVATLTLRALGEWRSIRPVGPDGKPVGGDQPSRNRR